MIPDNEEKPQVDTEGNTPAIKTAGLVTRIKAGLVWVVLYLLSLLPWGASDGLGRLVGRMNYRFNTRACKVTRVNLGLCLPELDEAEREKMALESLQQSAITVFETPKVWLNAWQKTLKKIHCAEGEELLKEAMAGDDGLIMLLPHLSNWEIYNVYMRSQGGMTALYLPPEKTYLARVMESVRGLYGNEMVPANRTGVARLYKRLQEGRVICILPDQVPASGDYIPFFGVEALTDSLVYRLLKKTGARVLSFHVIRRQRPFGFDVYIREVPASLHSTDRTTSMTTLNQVMEQCARTNLAQYQWDYKRFRERPAGEKKVYRFIEPDTFHS